MNKNTYSLNQNKFFDQVVQKKRMEMVSIVNDFLDNEKIESILDIGTTNDMENESSNLLIKKIKKKAIFKSISDQKIESSFFKNTLLKSITSSFSPSEINEFSSDLVISNATIEHVGNFVNQKQMLKNIIQLSKKKFIIITPNRYHPLELHTLIPFIHWLPKPIHRKLLKLFNLDFYAQEKNLNLLSKKDLKKLLEDELVSYEIKSINFLFFPSNFLLIGEKKTKF